MLTVVTTATSDYTKPWCFPSLGMLSCRVVALLEPGDDRPLPVNVERHPYISPGLTYQAGDFLNAVPGIADEDILVLVDADGVFQRDFDADELQTLNDLRDGFALGYNVGPGQRGEEEYGRLDPKQPIEEAAKMLDLPVSLLKNCWVYNTGVMAGRVRAWRHLHTVFATKFGTCGKKMFVLPSWPQYFICLLLSWLGVPVTELGYSVHSHGHLPLTVKHSISRRQLFHGGKRVLYVHNVFGCSHGAVLQFDADGKLIQAHKAATDADGVTIKDRLRKDNPTHKVIYLQGPVV